MSDVTEQFEAISKLTKDLKGAAKLLGKSEARFLVDFYYSIQDNRIRSDAQVRELAKKRKPSDLTTWCADNFRTFENNIKNALNVFTLEYTVGKWCQSICGIGPVITAGLLAHIDITKAPTYGHIWRFAGLDSTQEWQKKTKRPWNAQLKTLCAFKLGESFVKVQNNESDYYGQLFVRRRERENRLNIEGRFADQAKAQLGDQQAIESLRERKYPIKQRNFKEEAATLVWLEGRITADQAREFLLLGNEQKLPFVNKCKSQPAGSGVRMLPPAQIHARARRFAVKMFLAHLHHVMFEDYHERRPMCPYPFEKLGHDQEHYLPPPNWPSEDIGKRLTEMNE